MRRPPPLRSEMSLEEDDVVADAPLVVPHRGDDFHWG